ncbi:unnamed protein product [Calypogeia fissa]
MIQYAMCVNTLIALVTMTRTARGANVELAKCAATSLDVIETEALSGATWIGRHAPSIIRMGSSTGCSRRTQWKPARSHSYEGDEKFEPKHPAAFGLYLIAENTQVI